MYDNNYAETMKVVEKERSYLKGELANAKRMLSNLRSKDSTWFLQGDALPRKPKQESNENIDFAVETPPRCLTIPLNSTKYDESDHLLKTKLDEQLKEICKCHYQKYLNTKPIISDINKNNCLEQKCKLVIEKNNDNIETCN